MVFCEVLAQTTGQEKEMKETRVGKEGKVSLFADDVILHIKDPKDLTRKLLELVETFSKMARHKIKLQKSISSITNMHRKKRETKTITYTVALE